MKVTQTNTLSDTFPAKYICWKCQSELEVLESDLKVRETLGERKFCGVDCPVCGYTGPAPVSEIYSAKFLADKDTVGNFLKAVFGIFR